MVVAVAVDRQCAGMHDKSLEIQFLKLLHVFYFIYLVTIEFGVSVMSSVSMVCDRDSPLEAHGGL